jgi:hypothetical protein
MHVSVVEPIEQAVERVKLILFRPFAWDKWFILGFCAFLAYLGEGGVYSGGGNQFNGANGNFRSFFDPVMEWIRAHFALVIAVAGLFFLVFLALGLVLTWIRSRGRFMFLDGVVRNRAAVVEPWNEFARQGNSLFLFSVCFGLVACVVAVITVGAGLALAWPDIRAERFGSGALVALLAGLPLLFAELLACGVVHVLLEDFVVPAMYLRRQRVLEAWSIVRREVLAGQVGTIILYFLMKLVLAVGVGFIALVVTCLTCCLAALPYVGSVILLPLLVFRRSYSLCFLGQFGPGWRCFSEPIQPPLTPPFAAPPSAAVPPIA